MKYKHHNPFDYVNKIYDETSAVKSVQDLVVQLDDVLEIQDYMSAIEMLLAQAKLFVDVFNEYYPTYDAIADYREQYYELMGGIDKVEQRYAGGKLDPDRKEYYDNIRRELNKVSD